MSQRAPHWETLPLCHYHHQGAWGVHTRPGEWKQKFGRERDMLHEVRVMLLERYGEVLLADGMASDITDT